MDVRASLLKTAPVSALQFGVFRIAFGAYLAIHFAHLIPWGSELFGRTGTLGDPSVSPLHGVFPNVLARWDSPGAVTLFLVTMVTLSLLFAAGVWRRVVALCLWYGWACLFNRNPLISNPGIPYVGLMLLLSALVPETERLRFRLRALSSHPERSLGSHPERSEGSAPAFAVPYWVFGAAWVLMAVGYTYSGVVKLMSPSWFDGSALWHLLNNPLARTGWPRDLALMMPMPLIRVMTWGALAAEVLFLPLSLSSRLRPFAWAALLGMHLGIVMLVSFADLTLGMLMLHLFTWDGRWNERVRALMERLRARRASLSVAT